MPIFFLVVGIILVVVGINDHIGDLTDLVKEDFKPSGNQPGFQVWILAIFVAGSLGYVRSLKPVANAFLVLIVIAMLLSNKGFFEKITSTLEGK